MSAYGPEWVKCAKCGCLRRPDALTDGHCVDVEWCAVTRYRAESEPAEVSRPVSTTDTHTNGVH